MNNNELVSVEELEKWIKDFMDRKSFCGDYAPYMYADDKNANSLAHSLHDKIANKLRQRY